MRAPARTATQGDWLELPRAALPLWPSVPLEPYAAPKPVLSYLLCPQHLHARAQLFLRVRAWGMRVPKAGRVQDWGLGAWAAAAQHCTLVGGRSAAKRGRCVHSACSIANRSLHPPPRLLSTGRGGYV